KLRQILINQTVSEDVKDPKTKEIICPRHGGRFNLETGRATKLPATEALEVYEVEIQGNDVYINID
ncbi:MAG: Rieske 2Fe-2S domain-containing protein, partial [Leptonema sp. (in: bacteria)]